MKLQEIALGTEFLAKWGDAMTAAKRRGDLSDRRFLECLAIIAEPIPLPRQPQKAPIDANRPRNRLATKLVAMMTEPARPDATAFWSGTIGADRTINVRAAKRFFASVSARQRVTIRLTSPGGDPYEAQAIAQIVGRHTGVVGVVIPSYAHSAALQIAVTADRRICGPNARFLIHDAELRDRPRFTATQLRAIAADLERLDHVLHASIARACGVPLLRIQELARAETKLHAADALQLGLMDEVALCHWSS